MNAISQVSQRLLDDFIAKQDADTRVPRALSEADVIELALHLLTIANDTPMSMPLQPVFNLAVARFEYERQR